VENNPVPERQAFPYLALRTGWDDVAGALSAPAGFALGEAIGFW